MLFINKYCIYIYEAFGSDSLCSGEHRLIEVRWVSWIDTTNESIYMSKFEKTDVTGCHHTIYGKKNNENDYWTAPKSIRFTDINFPSLDYLYSLYPPPRLLKKGLRMNWVPKDRLSLALGRSRGPVLIAEWPLIWGHLNRSSRRAQRSRQTDRHWHLIC